MKPQWVSFFIIIPLCLVFSRYGLAGEYKYELFHITEPITAYLYDFDSDDTAEALAEAMTSPLAPTQSQVERNQYRFNQGKIVQGIKIFDKKGNEFIMVPYFSDPSSTEVTGHYVIPSRIKTNNKIFDFYNKPLAGVVNPMARELTRGKSEDLYVYLDQPAGKAATLTRMPGTTWRDCINDDHSKPNPKNNCTGWASSKWPMKISGSRLVQTFDPVSKKYEDRIQYLVDTEYVRHTCQKIATPYSKNYERVTGQKQEDTVCSTPLEYERKGWIAADKVIDFQRNDDFDEDVIAYTAAAYDSERPPVKIKAKKKKAKTPIQSCGLKNGNSLEEVCNTFDKIADEHLQEAGHGDCLGDQYREDIENVISDHYETYFKRLKNLQQKLRETKKALWKSDAEDRAGGKGRKKVIASGRTQALKGELKGLVNQITRFKKASQKELGSELKTTWTRQDRPEENPFDAYVRNTYEPSTNGTHNQKKKLAKQSLARALFAEMRSCGSESTLYMKVAARTILNRALAIQANERPVHKFVAKEKLDPSLVADPFSINTLIPNIVSAPLQFSSVNVNDLNILAIICPQSDLFDDPADRMAWKNALLVANQVIDNPMQLIRETPDIHEQHYTTRTETDWTKKMSPINHFKLVINGKNDQPRKVVISNPDCLTIWRDETTIDLVETGEANLRKSSRNL
jgi:hypothetical protein